jgi:uncharacterized Zn finger protein
MADLDVACRICGSVYELTAHKIVIKESGVIQCKVCGQVIFVWDEAKLWSAKLVIEKSKPVRDKLQIKA